MKFRTSYIAAVLSLVFVATACGVAVPQAHATVVLDNGVVATAIEDLIVNGVHYNVQWVANASDNTFVGNVSGATAAANAINVALNGTPFAFVALQGDGSIDQYLVQAGAPFSGVRSSSLDIAGNWHILPSGSTGSVAVFTQVASPVPEPTSLILFGSALVGFGVMRRRRRFAAAKL